MIQATCVADSISPDGIRLLAIQGRIPETIWNEVLTHRMFSRNSSSSRAVPVAKWIAEARSKEQRVTPIRWGQNQRGMQQGEELTGDALRLLQNIWDHAAMDAAYHAERMVRQNAHKEIVNQILKPYVHANVVVTATEWMNFFGLRLDQAAKPEIRLFAELIWEIWNEHEPTLLRLGEWHLPFLDDDESFNGTPWRKLGDYNTLAMISAARCARISYTSHETGRRSTVDEDLALAARLVADGHWSPFEHQATPDSRDYELELLFGDKRWWNLNEHGNFRGWRQFRKMFANEAVRPLPEEHR